MQVKEFTALYEREFGVRLTVSEAEDVATRFLTIYALLNNAIHPICSEKQ